MVTHDVLMDIRLSRLLIVDCRFDVSRARCIVQVGHMSRMRIAIDNQAFANSSPKFAERM